MRSARALALLIAMALVLLPACSVPSVSLAPSAPSDTRVVVTFITPHGMSGQTGGLEALDVNTGQILWKTQLGGVIEGHPTIANGVVYASTNTHFFSVRESDGKLLLRAAWDRCPPNAGVGGRIFVDEFTIALHCGVLHVLDPATGAERWHLANPVERSVMRHGVIYATADLMGDASDLIPQSPRTPAPTFDFRLHPPVAKALVALNERDGSLLWQVREDVDLEAVALTDRTLYVAGASTPAGTVIPYVNSYAFDAHSGRRLTASSHTATGTVDSTIYATGQVVAATDRFVFVYDYQTDPMHPRTWALSASDGKVLWDVPGDVLRIEDMRAIIRISGDFIYTSAGGVTAVRVRDGSVAWNWYLTKGDPTAKTYNGGCDITSLRVIGGSVFMTLPWTNFCNPKLVSLNAATGALNWQHNLAGARDMAVPAMEWMTTNAQGAEGD